MIKFTEKKKGKRDKNKLFNVEFLCGKIRISHVAHCTRFSAAQHIILKRRKNSISKKSNNYYTVFHRDTCNFLNAHNALLLKWLSANCADKFSSNLVTVANVILCDEMKGWGCEGAKKF